MKSFWSTGWPPSPHNPFLPSHSHQQLRNSLPVCLYRNASVLCLCGGAKYFEILRIFSSKIITWSLEMTFDCSHCYYSHCTAFEEQIPPLFSLKTVSGSQSRKRGWAKNLKKFDENLTKKRLSSPGHNSQVRWNIFKQTLGVPLFIPFEGI